MICLVSIKDTSLEMFMLLDFVPREMNPFSKPTVCKIYLCIFHMLLEILNLAVERLCHVM